MGHATAGIGAGVIQRRAKVLLAGGVMLSHTGGKTMYTGPKCDKCRNFRVSFYGEYCKPCLDERIEKKAMAGLLLIFLVASLLIMGFVSAYGQYVRMN